MTSDHIERQQQLNKSPTYVFGSLARISNLETVSFQVEALHRSQWATGDYIVGRYVGRFSPDETDQVETTTGQLVNLIKGNLVVGSLGKRAATQEICGDWHLIGRDCRMHDICGSGLFGLETSRSFHYHSPPTFQYQGHVVRDGRKICMKDFVFSKTFPAGPPPCPTVLIMGTSMSSGKTETAQTVTRLLKELNFERLVYAKVTGSGYYHDVAAIAQQVDGIIDFVDAGLPSTVMPADEYRQDLRKLLGHVSTQFRPDCFVVELGASPCEPYNGLVALQELRHADMIILCATDAYSVLGLHHILGSSIPNFRAHVVCGIAANTLAGRDMVKQLTGLTALSLSTAESVQKMKHSLEQYLVLEPAKKAKRDKVRNKYRSLPLRRLPVQAGGG